MQESVVVTGNNVKFIGGVTPMTQENWQDYFMTFKKNGVIGMDDFTAVTDGLSSVRIYDGSVIVDGILARYETDDGYFYGAKPTSTEIDALFCVRVYLHEEKVEIVRKTGLAAGSSYQNCADVIAYMILHEDAYCTRNDQIFDVPIAYLNYMDSDNRVDVRRFCDPKARLLPGTNIFRGNGVVYRGVSGGNSYDYNGVDPFNPPDDIQLAIVPLYSGNVQSNFNLRYNIGASTNPGKLFNTVEPLVRTARPLTFYYTSDFTTTTNGIQYTTTIAENGTVVFTIRRASDSLFRFAFTAHQGGGSDGTWGTITGTLSNQADLQNALNAKQDVLTIDNGPLPESDNLVKSSGIYKAIEHKLMYAKDVPVSVATAGQIMRYPASGTISAFTTWTTVVSCVFANHSAIESDIEWTPYNGYIVFTGTCTEATTANIIFGNQGALAS